MVGLIREKSGAGGSEREHSDSLCLKDFESNVKTPLAETPALSGASRGRRMLESMPNAVISHETPPVQYR